MSPGDIVQPKFLQGIFLFPRLDIKTWNHFDIENQIWNDGVGIVIEILFPDEISTDLFPAVWIKILTSNGQGWCIADKVEKIEFQKEKEF